MNIDLIIFLGLLTAGYLVGSFLERRHYKDIEAREQASINQATVPSEVLPNISQYETLGMAVGNVVISVDYFKRFVAGLRNIFGGRVGAYEPLIDRARREAILRMKESYPEAEMFVHVRIETAAVGSQHLSKRGTACLEVCAYGTAVKNLRAVRPLRSTSTLVIPDAT